METDLSDGIKTKRRQCQYARSQQIVKKRGCSIRNAI